MASFRDDDEPGSFRVKMRSNTGQNSSGSGAIRGGWSLGWGGAMGAVKMPPAHRLAKVGRSAGKVAAASGSARMQRAVVKISYHKMSHAGAHARYLEREGAGLEQSTAHNHLEYLERERGGLGHEKGQAFDMHTGQPVDAAAMVGRWEREHDRYHFRGVLAGERTPENMTAMFQEMAGRAEIHCGTRFEGFFVHHHGDGNPHTHFVIRGRHENGKNLFIDGQYIAHGFRHSAQEYLTREFGERSDLEIQRGQERTLEIRMEREQGLERVRELAQEHGLEERDQLRLEHTMLRGSMKEIEQTHRRLDTLEHVREIEREIPRERAQEMERTAIEGSPKELRQVERQIDRVHEVVQQRAVRERELDRGRDMDMGL